MVAANNIKVYGFYTEEIRKNRVREGFDVVSLDGLRGRLARDLALLNSPVKAKVGKYGVLIEEFENVALPCLNEKQFGSQSLLVIDEIGKMEFFSNAFKNKIKNIFDQQLNYTVLATIPITKSDKLIENIRNHNKAKVWVVTYENRNHIYEEIMQEIETSLSTK
ncbi:cancer-related nucleoside-triphosphatase homolog isoform X2 [Manduca sexta]|uniref:Uncharacterized protein n=2 Tax=Manduca sexta TaxID=7130 RepID=A0A921ZVG0_MANSE|nr:cancer-related nucleoside-triphosphatase homolog isoform X2 [Manduca sexta]KAG6464186.1 hypothetical protein O3G_MSEX014345 [Manduca sexta]